MPPLLLQRGRQGGSDQGLQEGNGGLAERFVADGGEIEIATAEKLVPGGVETSAGLRQGRVVIAAGAFSHRLAHTGGVKIPLETERGYNTTLPGDAFDLRMHITFGGHGFVISRLRTGLRVGGAVELGGLSLPPNYARADAMLQKAKQFLPGLKTEGGRQWMGFRLAHRHSTRMAVLAARGEMTGDNRLTAVSLISSTFTGRIAGTTRVGDRSAIVPEISGRGWITGIHQHMLDLDDPWPEGYRLTDTWGAR